MRSTSSRILAALALAAAFSPLPAQAQKPQLIQRESDGGGRTCSQVAQQCLARQGQSFCEGLRQGCLQTGTFQGAQGNIQNLQRR